MHISVIDIGTKSLKHYIFSSENKIPELLSYQRYSEANLGGDDKINQETEERVLELVKKCLEIHKSQNVQRLKIVGTEIFRRSKQAQELALKIKELSNVAVEILTQEKEAFYLYNGFVDLVGPDIDFAAANIGGGSTEIVLGDNQTMKYSQKLPFGVNFLKSKFGPEEIDWAALDRYLDENIKAYQKTPNNLFITGVFDFLKVVAPQLGFTFDPSPLRRHPLSLKFENYQALVRKIRETPVAILRNMYAQDPDFSNNVAIGQSVYLKIAEKLGSQLIIPSANDLTEGIIREIV